MEGDCAAVHRKVNRRGGTARADHRRAGAAEGDRAHEFRAVQVQLDVAHCTRAFYAGGAQPHGSDGSPSQGGGAIAKRMRSSKAKAELRAEEKHKGRRLAKAIVQRQGWRTHYEKWPSAFARNDDAFCMWLEPQDRIIAPAIHF